MEKGEEFVLNIQGGFSVHYEPDENGNPNPNPQPEPQLGPEEAFEENYGWKNFRLGHTAYDETGKVLSQDYRPVFKRPTL